MTGPICTDGMRHAAEEDDNTGNYLQANYLRTGADEIDRLRAELAGSGRMRKPIKVVEQGPRTVAPQWALFKGMDIAHHFIPEAEFRKRAELATYIAESLYWCAQPLQGGPPQEPLIVEITGLRAELAARDERIAELESLINSPSNAAWFEGVRIEAAHQIERWGSSHDAGKEPLDWFWLIGFLAQKAATAAMEPHFDKAKHHTISTGAALLNWHRQLSGDNVSMRPGIDTPRGEAS